MSWEEMLIVSSLSAIVRDVEGYRVAIIQRTQVCKYCARPPLAMERLEPMADGRLLYRFKRPWRDGTTHIVFQPLELLEKLAAIVPAPKTHLVRYSGILAPAAKWRARIVPAEPSAEPASMIHPCCAQTSAIATDFAAASVEAHADPALMESPLTRHGRNYTWAELMKRVWALDVLECPRCQSRMRILAAIHPPEATRKILECVGLPSRATSGARALRTHRMALNTAENRGRIGVPSRSRLELNPPPHLPTALESFVPRAWNPFRPGEVDIIRNK